MIHVDKFDPNQSGSTIQSCAMPTVELALHKLLFVPVMLVQTYGFGEDPMDILPPVGSLSASIIIVEVGTSVVASYFKHLDDESVLLIGIEPDPELVLHHPRHPRFFMLPVAIADVPYIQGGPPTQGKLHRTEQHQCNSLLRPKSNQTGGCANELYHIDVPALPLAPVLERIASYGPIQLLTLDTQGTELDVIKSGSVFVSSVARVVVEVTAEGTKLDTMEHAFYQDHMWKRYVL